MSVSWGVNSANARMSDVVCDHDWCMIEDCKCDCHQIEDEWQEQSQVAQQSDSVQTASTSISTSQSYEPQPAVNEQLKVASETAVSPSTTRDLYAIDIFDVILSTAIFAVGCLVVYTVYEVFIA